MSKLQFLHYFCGEKDGAGIYEGYYQLPSALADGLEGISLLISPSPYLS
jgi:hypothetical protein